MTDSPNGGDVRDLSDLHIDTIRRENDHVDDRMAELESEISDYKQQVATLEDEKEDLVDEKEATEKLLAEFKETQRDEQLTRIKQANEAADADDEVDISTLEDASVDQLETVADLIEATTGGTVSNAGDSPEFDFVEDDDKDLTDRMAEIADNEGLLGMYESVTADDEADAGGDPSLSEMVAAYEQNNGNAGGAF